jgi:orotidine-5'-phosphate decarboxylase
MTDSAKEKIIVALDAPDAASANRLVDDLDGAAVWVKVGLQLFTAEGPRFVESLKSRGLKVFLDLKFHDIPNTAGEAVRSAVALGVDMATIHLGGGPRMVGAAVDAADGSGLLVLGVSVLTSFDEAELAAVGVASTPAAHVGKLVAMGVAAGVRGVVCSPQEIGLLRGRHGDGLTIVTPGVRPAGADVGDQRRVMEPWEAVSAGASYLVIGRPITAAPSPRRAMEEILRTLAPGS